VGLNPGFPHEIVVAVGKYPMETFRSFCKVTQIPPPEGEDLELAAGKALVRFRNGGLAPFHVNTICSTKERRRHVRQYAVGEFLPRRASISADLSWRGTFARHQIAQLP